MDALQSKLCNASAPLGTRKKGDRIVTSEKWKPHLSELATFGVVAECDGRDAVALSGCFAVPKADGLGRSIFNGRFLCDILRNELDYSPAAEGSRTKGTRHASA